MEAKLSNRLLNTFNCTDADEPKLRKELNSRLNHICKPCWELKYCPYGPLVEDFPLPPMLVSDYREHMDYIKACIEKEGMGPEHDIPLDDVRRQRFQEDVDNYDESQCVEKLSKFETEASCKEFGHLCPAFFVSEPFTETSSGRNHNRNISHATVIRVARRDNNTCQVCGKILLDREIEIDHIIPYSRGGTSDEHNLHVTCIECNRKKGKKITL